MHRFTIGIPTFNRASLLRESLKCAASQLDGNVRVVVVDNGSSDETQSVLASVPKNVRVYRNETNLGLRASFARTLDNADTDYFSWLQDDDLLHPSFLHRADLAFKTYPEASVYMAYAANTGSRTSFAGAYLYGPPVPLLGRDLHLVDSGGLIALSLLCSVAIPPVIVYRRTSLLDAMNCWSPEYHLYAERSVLNAVLCTGPAIVDGTIGGIYFDHPRQEWKQLWTSEGKRREDWCYMALQAQKALADFPGWKQQVLELIGSSSTQAAQTWLDNLEMWDSDLPESRYLRECLTNSGLQVRRAGKPRGDESFTMRVKRYVRQLVPPLLWEFAAKSKRML